MRSCHKLLTVAICTYNHYDHLTEVLSNLKKQTADAGLYTILIVDNSTNLVARDIFFSNYTESNDMNVIHSHPPGLSRARNKALESCETPFIAFLDDDAVPCPDWVECIIKAFKNRPSTAVVAGPILPRWPSTPPEWLSPELHGFYSVLDLGLEDRVLGNAEYAYGANISLNVAAARAAGGFQEGLGRVGAGNLLSSEEVELQDALRVAGGSAWYAAGAQVWHYIAPERIRRNWVRARAAWQAVSEALQEPTRFNLNTATKEVMRLRAKLGVDDFTSLFNYRDPEAFADQVALMRHLVGLLLHTKFDNEDQFEKIFTKEQEFERPKPNVSRPKMSVAASLTRNSGPSIPIRLGSRHLLAEASPGHDYLYNLYGEIAGCHLLSQNFDPWRGTCRPYLSFVSDSITPAVSSICLLTLDPFIYRSSEITVFRQFVETSPVPVFGILHRFPDTPEMKIGIHIASKVLAGIICLSRQFHRHLRDEQSIDNAYFLPHHPSTFTYLNAQDYYHVRERLGIRPSQIVFSMIGEMRRGKGYKLLIDSFTHIPVVLRKNIFFLFAGKTREISSHEISNALTANGLSGYVDLRSNEDPREFALISSVEYADYVTATDIGLLLYQEDQRFCASGVLPDFIWSRKRLIATDDSFVGMEVRENDLGWTLKDESPDALARLFVEAAEAQQADPKAGDSYERYRSEIAPDQVVRVLRTILEQAGKVT